MKSFDSSLNIRSVLKRAAVPIIGREFWVAGAYCPLYGATVRLKSQKNDANDAEAICEAVTRPHMRFVPQKSVEQQDLQCLHRVRSRLVSCRTQLINQIRGLLAEYGIVLPQHRGQVRSGLPTVRKRHPEAALTEWG